MILYYVGVAGKSVSVRSGINSGGIKTKTHRFVFSEKTEAGYLLKVISLNFSVCALMPDSVGKRSTEEAP